jgi:hypothetical protein
MSSNGFVICSLSSLSAGTSANVSLTLAVEPRPFFTNVSFVGSSDIDPNPSNNVAITIVAMGGGQDFDADGLPDWWELANGTDPRVPDSGADPDFDGLTNVEEYLAGTDPHDPASVLRITRIALENGTNSVVLSFLSVSNRTYSVLGSMYPTGSWTNIAQVTARQDGITTVTNSSVSAPARFYRVVTP